MPAGKYIRSEKHKELLRSMCRNRLGTRTTYSQEKKCTACFSIKPIADFRLLRKVNRWLSVCKECERNKAKKIYIAHREERLAHQRQHRLDNIETIREQKRKKMAMYRKNDPMRFRISRNTDNAKRRTALSNSQAHFTKNELISIGEYQNWRCAACHCDVITSYHIDHIWPLSQGGSDVVENIQLLCKTCNLSKGKKTPLEFMIKRSYRGKQKLTSRRT